MPIPKRALSERVMMLLQRLTCAAQAHDNETTCCFGVTRLQALVMLELLWGGTLTMQEISTKVCLAPSTMTRVVEKLARAGFVKRLRSKRDRRSVKCVLTEKGVQLCELLQDCFINFYESLLEKIPPGERSKFPHHLQLFLESMVAMIGQESA